MRHSLTSRRCGLVTLLVTPALIVACQNPPANSGPSVWEAWKQPPPASKPDGAQGNAPDRDDRAEPPASDPVAVVEGRAISRGRFVELLLRGSGVTLLEQLIVTEAAERRCREEGITVTQDDIDAEHANTLRELLRSGPDAPLDDQRRAVGERLLDQVLAGRNMSRAEYLLGMRRNAYVRRLAVEGLEVTDAQVRAEFDRQYGPRVEIRDMVVSALDEAQSVAKCLAAGADFAQLARARRQDASDAGNQAPVLSFSRQDLTVPALLREAAFRLQPGDVSNPMRIDGSYHIIRVERRIAPQDVEFDAVREALTVSLRGKLIVDAMQRVYRDLFDHARVEIRDPSLREAFNRRHPNRSR